MGRRRAKSATSRSRKGLRASKPCIMTGAIHFGEDAIGQIDLGVELECAVDEIGLAAGFPGLEGFGVQILGSDALAE